jgi:hypothetical protein
VDILPLSPEWKSNQWGGVMYHLEDGGSISTLEGGWKYFTIIEKEK